MKRQKNANPIANVLQSLTDLLFPRRCAFCDGIVPKETLICESCQKSLPLIRDPYCMKCGKKLKKQEAEYCADCSKNPHLFTASRSVLAYNETVGRSIYRFKYGGRKEYARVYATLTAELLGGWLSGIAPDIMVPVPLHKSRFRKRGYNQSALYARQLEKLTGIKVREDLVIRVKKTKPQKLMDYAGRRKNLKKAFLLRQNDVKSKIVLLVDDIYTTGSTLDALAEVFLAAGAKKVYGLTIAGGIGKGGANHGS